MVTGVFDSATNESELLDKIDPLIQLRMYKREDKKNYVVYDK